MLKGGVSQGGGLRVVGAGPECPPIKAKRMERFIRVFVIIIALNVPQVRLNRPWGIVYKGGGPGCQVVAFLMK